MERSHWTCVKIHLSNDWSSTTCRCCVSSREFSSKEYSTWFFLKKRPLLAGIAERYSALRRPRTIPTSIGKNEQTGLYTSCSFDETTGEKMTCTLSILPQVDQLPSMFTYVSLQRNFLVNSSENNSIEEKNLLFSVWYGYKPIRSPCRSRWWRCKESSHFHSIRFSCRTTTK